MLFNQSEMMYTDYYWGFRYLPRDPHTDGEFDRTVLTRTEGPQMLYCLNRYAEIQKWRHPLRDRLQKLEYIIREKVPDNLDCQCEVKQWLDEHIKQIWRRIAMMPKQATY